MDLQKASELISDFVRSIRPEIIRASSRPEDIDVILKKDSVDVSTSYDAKIEDSIRYMLEQAYPGTGFYVEEGVNSKLDKEYIWYIDPVDGTKFFKAGLPGFTCSIGLLHHDQPVFGFIYDFALDVIYCGWEGHPTTRNDRKINVIDKNIPYESIQIIADRAQRYAGWEKDKNWINLKLSEMSRYFYRERDFGLGALSCAMVAGGLMNMGAIVTLTGESGTKQVDIAAGRALIRYAGGREKRIPVTGLSFSHVLVAGASHVVDKIEKIIIE